MYYVDTSVLVSALTVEAGSQAARNGWRSGVREVFVSHWMATEFSSSLSIKKSRGNRTGAARDVLLAKYDEWTQQVFRVLPVSREDFDFRDQTCQPRRKRLAQRWGPACFHRPQPRPAIVYVGQGCPRPGFSAWT